MHVIKLWFKLGNYKQCKAIFDIFEREIAQLTEASFVSVQQGLIDEPFSFEALPEKVRMSYTYFHGRYLLYNNNLGPARAALKQAFKISSQFGNSTNVTQVLRFLIPAEMLGGKYPTDQYLEKHGLAS